MSLKDYQQKSLNQLQAYLEAVPLHGVQQAFERVRAQHPPRFKKNKPLPAFNPLKGLEDVPYICLRLPTGGGKTLLCAHSIGLFATLFPEKGLPLCLWLVPSDTIRTQTLETLKNPHHLNYRALQDKLGSAFRALDISEFVNIRPYDLEQYACIVVSTFAALRVEKTKTASRHVYDHHEELEAHFDQVDPNHPGLERDPKKNNEIKHSFVNLLHLKQPLVLIDEAHNAKSPLSMELLERINPACVIEYTATPAANSNILVSVSAQELKDEQMIKLPIHLQSHNSWQQAVSASIQTRARLEKLSHKEPDYIRPIVLFQAENKNGDVNVEALKNHLCTQEKIPAEQIAIATGSQRELDNINLFDRTCPIKYIITVQALKEGWDCSFAYVLCSVANTQSSTAAEQLLGRVLRMPYASARQEAGLNEAFAHVSSKSWQHALSQLQERLISMGFEQHEAQDNIHLEPEGEQEELPGIESGEKAEKKEVEPFTMPLIHKPNLAALDNTGQAKVTAQQTAGGFQLEVQNPTPVLLQEIAEKAINDNADKQEMVLRSEQWRRRQSAYLKPAERGDSFTVPKLCLLQGNLALPLEIEPCLNPEGWHPLDYYQPISEAEFSIDEKANVALVNIENETLKVAQSKVQQQTLIGIPTEVTLDDLTITLTRQLAKLLPRQTVDTMGHSSIDKLRSYIAKALHDLSCRADMNVPLIHYWLATLKLKLKERLLLVQIEAYKQAFQRQLFADDGRIGTDPRCLFTFSPHHYPVSKLYTGKLVFDHHYYRQIADMNNEEAECAWALERQWPKIKYWVRNLENQMMYSFWLQTSTDKFYPDFVAQLENGRVLVVEYKGGHLDNEDSREKEQIGKIWAEKGGNLFIMVWKKDKQGRDMDAQLQSLLQSS